MTELSEFWKEMPEPPTTVREASILEAVEQGNYDPIDWVPIRIPFDSGRELCIQVAEDALSIDGVRVNVTMTTMQRIVDVLGHAFPTSKISDLIHSNATVVARACTQKPDASMAYTSRMIKHSEAVEAQIGTRVGLASTVGKDWVLTNRLCGRPDKSANYGWHDKAASYTSVGGLKLWQPLGTAHDRWHVDYSQVVRLVARNCVLDGEPRDLIELLQSSDPVVKVLSYEGSLLLDRMPGVALYKPDRWVPDDTEGTLGERCVAWCMKHLGHKEDPPGSNDSELIRKWLAPCARGYDAKRVVLGVSKTEWCAALQCAAMEACLIPGEDRPHDYRASVVELVEDTAIGRDGKMPFSGRYKPIQEVREGPFTPCVGDLAIWDRSNPSKPSTSWFRHVNRVVSFNSSDNTFQTIGGNESNKVAVAEHYLGESKLLGFIHYPQEPLKQGTPSMFTEDERKEILSQVSMSLRGMSAEIWKR